jgi:hypothetical protein
MKYIVRIIRILIFWIQDYFSEYTTLDLKKPIQIKKSIFKRIFKYARIMKTDWIIYRFEKTDKGTISANLINTGDESFNQFGYNIELPYRDNRINVSCILSGFYPFKKIIRPNGEEAIEIQNVLNRTNVLAHSGNYMKDTKGCILPNISYSYTKETRTPYGITSRPQVKQILNALPTRGVVHII